MQSKKLTFRKFDEIWCFIKQGWSWFPSFSCCYLWLYTVENYSDAPIYLKKTMGEWVTFDTFLKVDHFHVMFGLFA